MPDKETWREALVVTLRLYNQPAEQLFTVFTAVTPEYGKLAFSSGSTGNRIWPRQLWGSGMRWQESS